MPLSSATSQFLMAVYIVNDDIFSAVDVIWHPQTCDRFACHFTSLASRGFNSHPGQSFSLSLCGPISISRANAHMVHMG